jgi:hypothetical protein
MSLHALQVQHVRGQPYPVLLQLVNFKSPPARRLAHIHTQARAVVHVRDRRYLTGPEEDATNTYGVQTAADHNMLGVMGDVLKGRWVPGVRTIAHQFFIELQGPVRDGR